MLGDVLTDPAPQVSPTQAESLARRYFDIVGTATPLDAERDRNFHIGAVDGSQWVLKVVHPAEPQSTVELQCQVLANLADDDPTLPVPRVRLARTGDPVAVVAASDAGGGTSQRPLRLRMYSFLPGRPLRSGESSPELRRNLGSVLGRLDRALARIPHPPIRPDIAWDAGRVLEFRLALADSDLAGVDTFLDHFRDHAVPLMSVARQQLIHNDVNPRNVMVDDRHPQRLAGVIDFGDMIVAPVVQDLATAGAYHLGLQVPSTQSPLESLVELTSSFHREFPLDDSDFALLFDLLRARVLVIIAITQLRLRGAHTNRAYISRNVALARAEWALLDGIDCRTAMRYLRDRCR